MTEVVELGQSLLKVAAILDEMSVTWAIGGSVASSVYGDPRSTNRVDVIALMWLR